jgi:hypothetical protein
LLCGSCGMALYFVLKEGSKAKVEWKSISHFPFSRFGEFPGQQNHPTYLPSHERCLWGQVKTGVFQTRPVSLDKFKERNEEDIQAVPDMILQRTIDDINRNVLEPGVLHFGRWWIPSRVLRNEQRTRFALQFETFCYKKITYIYFTFSMHETYSRKEDVRLLCSSVLKSTQDTKNIVGKHGVGVKFFVKFQSRIIQQNTIDYSK